MSLRAFAFPLVISALVAACGGTAFQDTSVAGGGGSSGQGGAGGTGGTTNTGGTGGVNTGGTTSTGGTGGVNTGGTTSTGGTGGVNAGGAPGTGGAAPDGGSLCTSNVVKFRLKVPLNATYCVNRCTDAWLSVYDAGGRPESVSQGCVTLCNPCQPIACAGAACAAPQPVPSTGLEWSWTGTYYEGAMCTGNGTQNNCVTPQCSAPGTYYVKMCVELQTAGATTCGSGSQVCATKQFTFPSATVVELSI